MSAGTVVLITKHLEHYGLVGSVAAGEVGNMKQIAGLTMSAGKVVTV